MIPDPEALLAVALRVALAAAALARSSRVTAVSGEVGEKSTPTDPVTAADRAVERLIVDSLLAARPQDAMLGEEGGGRTGTSGVEWVVDPIDGTVNYLYGIPAYAV